MYPIENTGVGKGLKVRRFPYIIVPVDPPKEEVPAGSLFMESLVFCLIQHPPEKVLADYCETKALDATKYRCHPVVFAKDLRRDGKGMINIERIVDGFHGRINWRR